MIAIAWYGMGQRPLWTETWPDYAVLDCEMDTSAGWSIKPKCLMVTAWSSWLYLVLRAFLRLFLTPLISVLRSRVSTWWLIFWLTSSLFLRNLTDWVSSLMLRRERSGHWAGWERTEWKLHNWPWSPATTSEDSGHLTALHWLPLEQLTMVFYFFPLNQSWFFRAELYQD